MIDRCKKKHVFGSVGWSRHEHVQHRGCRSTSACVWVTEFRVMYVHMVFIHIARPIGTVGGVSLVA